MAKYCSKCGRSLPDGVEICPSCHGGEAGGKEAALFTQITAETEVWRTASSEPDKKRPAKKRRPEHRERALLYALAVVLLLLAGAIVAFSMPSSKVARALRAEDYDKALGIYTEKLMGRHKPGDAIVGGLLAERAEKTYTSYAAEETDGKSAERVFGYLMDFGLSKEEINGSYDSFKALKATRDLIAQAEKLAISDKVLEAAELLMTVEKTAPEYEKAADKAAECTQMFADSVLEKAKVRAENRDYAAAIDTLIEGNELLKGYGSYSGDIGTQRDRYCNEYEQYTLEEAKNLAGIESYNGAAALVRRCIDYVGKSAALNEALAHYEELAADKTASDAIRKADELFERGQYTDAFLELDAAEERLGETQELKNAVDVLKKRFESKMRSEAGELIAGSRENVESAIEFIENARSICDTESLAEYREQLEGLLPYRLAEADYVSREGDVYRNSGDFESLDGKVYTDGWLWGQNESSIEYELGGEYDELSGIFTVRRDDDKKAAGHFEVWCDGECRYVSEELAHDGESIEFSYDISGCGALKIVFCCDYETSTAEGGFCYHGLCDFCALKNMA